jgi:branched-chain amino acid transport system substrate-binding protein
MAWRPNRRQFLAAGGAAAASATIPGRAGQAQSAEALRIGAVVPSRSGLGRTLTSINDFIGQAARQGSLLGEGRVGMLDPGLEMIVLQASAPTPESAIRAAERLVELDHVDALIGGVGEGQLGALIPIAEAAGIPLFNVGTQADEFRRDRCHRLVFHIEASDAMYLDALIGWSAEQGHRRWFIVHEDNERGHAMQARVLKSITKLGLGGESVGAAATAIEQPVYYGELDQARRAEPDAILVLLSAVDQIAFLGQLQSARVDAEAITFPEPVVQTRDYKLALMQLTRGFTPTTQFQLWETTLTEGGAGAFNEAYLGRFSGPADPTAWSAYSATKILYETVLAVGSADGDAIVAHLESGVEFDLFKGSGTSFRAWDHQLRQPLYRVQIDPDYPLERGVIAAALPSQLGFVSLQAEIPEGGTGDRTTRLDMLGDGPEDSVCRL